MSLWEYANPVKFLKLSDKVLPFFVGFSIIGLSIGLFGAFFSRLMTIDRVQQ